MSDFTEEALEAWQGAERAPRPFTRVPSMFGHRSSREVKSVADKALPMVFES